MGVVYRAHDQVLGKAVALKFLPPRLAADPDRRELFQKEVRSAQEVSHPCVARVHDIGEHDGQPFLSMKCIDGGDLASLLKRSGRLAEETAAKYARQLCAGLAAIHRQGLLHRDLKPQNIMIDESGRVRITDFGLAGRVGSFAGGAVRAGTPLYQSPEQLAGIEVTARSDIYSLGLVLYEMFTGKRAFEATTHAELIHRHRDGSPANPSSHVPHFDPVVERIILKSLEPDPQNRPRSAMEVLREFPGGKLDEKLFRDETPEPGDVAESGGEGSLSPTVAMVLLAITLTGILLTAWLNDHATLFRRAITDRAPRELSRLARDHLRDLGYVEPASDTAEGFATDESLLKLLRKDYPISLDRDVFRTKQLPVMYFWYRQSPNSLAQLLSANDSSGWSMPGRVLPNEPPLREEGMTCVFLDLEGNLLELHAVPPRTPLVESAREPDPKLLLKAAGFNVDSLRESKEFHRVPPVFADRRMAWESVESPVRIEAAFYDGRLVYFHVGPPDHPERLPRFMPDNPTENLLEVKHTLLGLVALPIGIWFAWRNWKLGRANPRGASIVAGCFIAMGMVG